MISKPDEELLCTIFFGNNLQVIIYNLKVITSDQTLDFFIEEISQDEIATTESFKVENFLSSDAIQIMIVKIKYN
jgi:transposase-like protein